MQGIAPTENDADDNTASRDGATHRSRRVFTFHRPETFAERAAEPDTLRARLKAMPTAHPLATDRTPECQIAAITGLEQSFADDLDYTSTDLDCSVVVPDQPSGARSTGREACPQGERGCDRQIRTIPRTCRDVLQAELFPCSTLVPKTLIFVKDDSHAGDIVHLCRKIFGKGNDFCKQNTRKTHISNPKSAKAL